MMPPPRFRKGQGLPHIAGIALSQRIIPAFDMRGHPRLFADALMRVDRKDGSIGSPEVAETLAATIRLRQFMPQMPTRLFAPIPDGIRHNVPGAPTFDRPQPCFVDAAADKGTEFIGFEDIIRCRWQDRRAKRRQRTDFF